MNLPAVFPEVLENSTHAPNAVGAGELIAHPVIVRSAAVAGSRVLMDDEMMDSVGVVRMMVGYLNATENEVALSSMPDQPAPTGA